MGGHPPYSPDLSPCDYAIFGPLKKALRGKRFTSDDDLVRAELVHNTALGIWRDSHSLLCVAVGQQPGPILLTCRYWFLFLGLRLISFIRKEIFVTSELIWIYRWNQLLQRVKTRKFFTLCSINLNIAFISDKGNVQPVLNLDPCVMKHLWCDIVDSSINYFI